MDSVTQAIANDAFILGFQYGQDWFLVFLVVILGAFVYKIVRGL